MDALQRPLQTNTETHLESEKTSTVPVSGFPPSQRCSPRTSSTTSLTPGTTRIAPIRPTVQHVAGLKKKFGAPFPRAHLPMRTVHVAKGRFSEHSSEGSKIRFPPKKHRFSYNHRHVHETWPDHGKMNRCRRRNAQSTTGYFKHSINIRFGCEGRCAGLSSNARLFDR